MYAIDIASKKRNQFIDITAKIKELIEMEEFYSGMCLVFCPHTTAGLTINENADPDVQLDILQHLEELVPGQKAYKHAEGNSDSHIKASLMGFSLTVMVEKGKLALGTWQGVYFCEFDGPRQRTVQVRLIKI